MKRAYLVVFIVAIQWFFSIPECSADSPNICPSVKQCTLKNFEIKIDSSWRITSSFENAEIQQLALAFSDALNKNFDLIVYCGKASDFGRDKCIEFLLKDDLLKQTAPEDFIPSQVVGDEGYVINVFRDRILVIGNKPQGIFYGMQTLFQMFNKGPSSISMPAVKIIDYPLAKIRGVHVLGVNLDEAKDLIDMMSRLKMNFVIFQSGKYFQLGKEDNLERFKEIYLYAKMHYIEAVPEISTFGVGIDVFNIDPMTAEGTFICDERYRFVNNEAFLANGGNNPMVNVIRSEDSDILVKSLTGRDTFVEGKDYRVIDGDISPNYDSSARPTRIIRVEGGSIKDGEEVLISYDLVEKRCKDCEWSVPYCPSSERTYKVVFGVLEDIIKDFQPSYISVTHDEIRGINRDSRCLKRNLSNAEILSDELTRLNDFVSGFGLGTRLLIWDDMVNPWHNGGDEQYQEKYGGKEGNTSDAIYTIPRGIILMSWWYDSKDTLCKMKNTPHFYDSLGFNYLAAGYKDADNIAAWAKATEGSKGCMGMIVTTWDGWKRNIEGIRYTAETAW